MCHWSSKTEAKIILGAKVATHYLEREIFIQQALQ